MDELPAIKVKIQERLQAQNKILQTCVEKYKNSNENNEKIADQISKITDALTQHTKDLKTLESQHIAFRNAKESKEQSYLADKAAMLDDFNKEKKTIKQEQENQVKAAQDQENQVKIQITEEQEGLKREALEAAEKRKEEEDAKKKEAFEQAENASKEAAEQAKREIGEFKEKLENEKAAADAKEKEASDIHKIDLAKATSNEDRLVKMQDEITRLMDEQRDSKTKQGSVIEELNTKSQSDIDRLILTHNTAIEELKTNLTQQQAEVLATKEEEHKSLMDNLMQKQELKVSAGANTSQAKIQELETQLVQCNKKYAQSENLYKENMNQIKELENDMATAEAAAGQALLASVNKLDTENKLLQAQINKMTESQPPPPPDIPTKIPPPELRALPDPNLWVKKSYDKSDDLGEGDYYENAKGAVVNSLDEVKKRGGNVGGYKHGKSSKKENRRSLKSKLTAKKFSLKKRSKRGKRKGKSKKRRKSIKIRI